MTKAVIISAQFLVELPKDMDYKEAESYGTDWLSGVADTIECLDYRHPKIMGIYIRPVPVQIIDSNTKDIFDESNIIQF